MHLNKKYLGILVLARFQRKPIFRIKVYRRIILQCNGSWTPYIGGLLPHLIKTIIFHRNGSWKYTVISRVKSSEISVFLWDLASTRNYSLLFKHSLVTPLLKKQSLDKEILSNFRPVFNLSCDF